MTAPTSDERREIAAKLRALAHDNQGLLGAWQMRRVMDEGTRILGTVGLPDCAHVLERYADLIDPSDYDQPHEYCPNCGHRLV